MRKKVRWNEMWISSHPEVFCRKGVLRNFAKSCEISKNTLFYRTPLAATSKCGSLQPNNRSGVKTNPILGRVFRTLERIGGFLTLVRKIASKAVYFTNISHVIKMLISALFLITSWFNIIFCLPNFSFA